MNLGKNGDGSSWLAGFSSWLKSNWLILVLAIGIIGWVVRMEVFVQSGPRFTPDDAMRMEARWQVKFDALPPPGYQRYIDSRFTSVNRRLDEIHTDTLWLKNNLLTNHAKILRQK